MKNLSRHLLDMKKKTLFNMKHCSEDFAIGEKTVCNFKYKGIGD